MIQQQNIAPCTITEFLLAYAQKPDIEINLVLSISRLLTHPNRNFLAQDICAAMGMDQNSDELESVDALLRGLCQRGYLSSHYNGCAIAQYRSRLQPTQNLNP